MASLDGGPLCFARHRPCVNPSALRTALPTQLPVLLPIVQWNDYNVHFEFPEPTELPPPLLQLIDAE